MLITDEYRAEQEKLHDNPNYGTASVQYAETVSRLIENLEADELLDYGAGKLRLIQTISEKRLCQRPFRYIPYEPANPKYSEPPKPAEMVTCIDVLEHVEPDLLDNVLDDLERVTGRIGFFTIHCGPAVKVLSDGRNAHLIQQPLQWWLPRIAARFDIQTVQKTPGGYWFLVAAND